MQKLKGLILPKIEERREARRLRRARRLTYKASRAAEAGKAKAVRLLEQAIELGDRADAAGLLAYVHERSDEPAKAIEYYEMSVAAGDDFSPVQYGIFLLNMGKAEEAMRMFELGKARGNPIADKCMGMTAVSDGLPRADGRSTAARSGIPATSASSLPSTEASQGAARTAALDAGLLVGVLGGEVRDAASCGAVLDLAVKLRAVGQEDFARRLCSAVAMMTEDETVSARAVREGSRAFLLPEPGEDVLRKDTASGIDICVVSVRDAKAAISIGEISAETTVAVAFTSDPREVGFGEYGLLSTLLLRFDDVEDPLAKGAISRSQADELAGFLLDAVKPEEGEASPALVLFACDGGVSRSAGAASAFAAFAKGDEGAFRHDGGARPNALVKEAVHNALVRAAQCAAPNPLHAAVERRLMRFEEAKRSGTEAPGDDGARLSLEVDLWTMDDRARTLRRLHAGGVDRLLPDGAWVEGALYYVRGEPSASMGFVRWLERRLAENGANVVVISARAGARSACSGKITKVATCCLAMNGPDGASFLRSQLSLLEQAEGLVDAVFIEDFEIAKAAWSSRFNPDVRKEAGMAFESCLRCLPGAVFVLDPRPMPGDDAPIEELLEANERAFALHAYEYLEVSQAGEEGVVTVKRAFPRAHTRSRLDAGEPSVDVKVD